MKISKNSWIYRGAFWHLDKDKMPTETDLCQISGEWVKNIILGPPFILILVAIAVIIAPFALVEVILRKTKFSSWADNQINKFIRPIKRKLCPKIKVD